MIPFLGAATMPSGAGSLGVLRVRFPGNATTATMGVGDSIDVTLIYDNPGVAVDYREWNVFNGTSGTAWTNDIGSNSDTYNAAQPYNSSKSNWIGAGTYTITGNVYAAGDHTNALYESSPITLTVI